MDDKKQNFIKRELNYNKGVKHNLKNLSEALSDCDSATSMLKVLDDYPTDKDLQYKNKIFWSLILLTLVLFAAIAALIANVLYGSSASLYLFILPLITLITAFVYKESDTERQTLIAAIEDQYLQKKYAFENHREQEKIPHNEILRHYATLFKKGNHDNQIPYFASGHLVHDQQSLPYTIFQYHYINKRKETYTENGKRKTRIVYDHYDNWGVFVSDVNCPSFSITDYKNRHFPIPWSTSSIEFNKRHSITGENEIELAKLMQPANVLMFEKLLTGHSSFELLCNNAIPTLCWNFNWNILKPVNASPSSCIKLKQLSGHLAGLSMPEYEILIHDLKPLLEKLVK